jgi:hypothetical protein
MKRTRLDTHDMLEELKALTAQLRLAKTPRDGVEITSKMASLSRDLRAYQRLKHSDASVNGGNGTRHPKTNTEC